MAMTDNAAIQAKLRELIEKWRNESRMRSLPSDEILLNQHADELERILNGD